MFGGHAGARELLPIIAHVLQLPRNSNRTDVLHHLRLLRVVNGQ